MVWLPGFVGLLFGVAVCLAVVCLFDLKCIVCACGLADDMLLF